MIHQLQREQTLSCTLQEAWDFFSSPRNLNLLTPDSLNLKITHCDSESMHQGQIIAYKIKIAPLISLHWLTEITSCEQPASFTDKQLIGPFKYWHHTHHFVEKNGAVIMTDTVNYVIPFGIIGEIAHRLFVKNHLTSIFDSRQKLTNQTFNAADASAAQSAS